MGWLLCDGIICGPLHAVDGSPLYEDPAEVRSAHRPCAPDMCNAAKSFFYRGTRIKFITHDSMTGMRRRLDAVDADMLPVLWLPDSVSAEKGTRRRPGSSTPTRETWSRVWSASNSTNSKHVLRRRQHPCNGNHVRETWVLNIAHSSNFFDGGRSGGQRVIT